MSLVVAGPLGMMFGFVTWAALRGRGGLPGLILFVLFGSIGSWFGGLAAEAVGSAASDGVVALGGVIGATLASLTEVVAFGRPPRIA
jgi:hypothetical protein